MITVKGSDTLTAVVLAFKAADKGLRAQINAETRNVIGPVWTQAVLARATRPLDQVVLAKGARVKAGNPPSAVAATSGKALSGGLVPGDLWQPFEFGAKSYNETTTYTSTSRKGRRYRVTRHTGRQLPRHVATGRVIFPAFAEVAPRAVALWVQTVVRQYHRAADGIRG